MKNSRVQDWSGCAASFCRHNTEVLDMKKMITPSGPDDQISMWSKLPSHLGQIGTLKHVDLGKCSSHVFENLKDHLSQLLSLSATLHRGQPVVLSHFSAMKNLVKLKLKGYEIKKGAQNIFAVNHLSHLTQLRHLALTSVGNLNHTTLDSIISQCPQLTALELGSCANLTAQDATKLLRLSNLQKLRLEIVVSEASSAFVEAASRLEHLSHLELINVDVTEGFDVSLGLCTRLRTLIIIPTYVSQSAVTNYLLLSGIAKLQTTLRLVSWGLTMELLKVTDMFAAKWKGPNQFKSDAVRGTDFKSNIHCELLEYTAAYHDGSTVKTGLKRLSDLGIEEVVDSTQAVHGLQILASTVGKETSSYHDGSAVKTEGLKRLADLGIEEVIKCMEELVYRVYRTADAERWDSALSAPITN
ncbi:uncharacterized protein LOC103510030 [Diaphorina citri]|uniref:Uncharacterized protein LOC103510030 n=1 Tax=Diaphorina citri TaxID=121845 RepID=A0A3Q0IUT3_DIACI|nr:uncharacterized protein LOC103510030 [Diaphorina citri]